MDKEVLRKQIMVSQFVNAVGCPPDQATQFLQAAQWQWDVRCTCKLGKFLLLKLTLMSDLYSYLGHLKKRLIKSRYLVKYKI